MGTCWNCKTEVFLKDEETRCDRCKKIVRYRCNSCKQNFDVQNKKTKKKVRECKWCGFFLCPICGACSPTCPKYKHQNNVKGILKDTIKVDIDKWVEYEKRVNQIVSYFEEIKMGKEKTMCEFGVPKTYAKERIKQILARMKGFKVRNVYDQEAFEKRREEVLDMDIGKELTIGNSRQDGSYGQEYRDVFNLSVCMGALKYKKKSFINNKKLKIGYDSWIRIEENPCGFLDTKKLIVKWCPECKKTFSRDTPYCDECRYKKGYKENKKGDLKNIVLIEKLSDNPTCENIRNFKGGEKGGESKSERET